MLKLTEDKLQRKEFINNLFSMFDNFGNQGDRGFTMIINGKYGSGKTTLLGFMAELNEKEQKYDIVNYNAWENNLFDNPLIPILYEISKLKKKSKKAREKIKEGALKIARSLPKIFTGTLANAHCIDLTSLTEDDVNIFEEYDQYRNSIAEFRKILIEACKEKKVLFFVDELDRCLPEYQIKVLEAMYHLFEIPNLIVVIALDKHQLECSIKNRFGDAQNTLGYLAKFINYQVDLPDEGKARFIESLMSFKCSGYDSNETQLVKQCITNLFDKMNYTVRECKRFVDEINLICKSDDESYPLNYQYWYPILIAIIVIVKHSNEMIYKKWFYNIKETIYVNEKLKFKESPIGLFFEEVLKTNVGPVFGYFIKPDRFDGIAESFLVDFINAFCPIENLDENELVHELGININTYKQDIYYQKLSYPFSINQAIRQVKMIKA